MALSRQYQKKLKEYKALAKKADAQLRAIERASNEHKYLSEKSTKRQRTRAERHKHLKDYAYKTATEDITKLYGSGNRYDRVPYTTDKNGNKKYISIDELNKRLESMKKFLSKPSAYIRKTKDHSSYTDALNRSAKSFSDTMSKRLEFKVSFTPEEIRELMSLAEEQDLFNAVGRYEALDTIIEYQNNDTLIKAIKQAKKNVRGGYKDNSEKDSDATKIRKELESKGFKPSQSAILSTLLVNGVDFEKFKGV